LWNVGMLIKIVTDSRRMETQLRFEFTGRMSVTSSLEDPAARSGSLHYKATNSDSRNHAKKAHLASMSRIEHKINEFLGTVRCFQ
jgi:hypothetical protein